MKWFNRFKQWWTDTRPIIGIDFGSRDGTTMVMGTVKKGTLTITGTLFQANKDGDYQMDRNTTITRQAMDDAIKEYMIKARGLGRFQHIKREGNRWVGTFKVDNEKLFRGLTKESRTVSVEAIPQAPTKE